MCRIQKRYLLIGASQINTNKYADAVAALFTID